MRHAVVEALCRRERVDEVVFRGGYGRGAVGLLEHVAPSLRPFFTMIASKVAFPGETRPAGTEAA